MSRIKSREGLPRVGKLLETDGGKIREPDQSLWDDVKAVMNEYGWVAMLEIMLQTSPALNGLSGKKYAVYHMTQDMSVIEHAEFLCDLAADLKHNITADYMAGRRSE